MVSACVKSIGMNDRLVAATANLGDLEERYLVAPSENLVDLDKRVVEGSVKLLVHVSFLDMHVTEVRKTKFHG